MLNFTPFSRRLKTAGVTAMVSALAIGGATFAQDATPEEEQGGPSEGYPVAIHSGTCADLSDDMAYEIGSAITFGVSEDGEDPQTIGAEGGVTTVLLGVSNTVDNNLESLGNDGHSVVVHASTDDSTVIACGTISGAVNEGELALAITPVGDETVVGVAILQEDGDSTMAKVYLFDTDSAGDEASATPVS